MPPKSTKPPGKPFVKGDPRAGRPKGTRNKTTQEVRELAAGLVGDSAYQAKVKSRMLAGKLSPPVEALLWHYAYGKPVQGIELSTPSGPLEILIQAEEK